MGSTVEGGCRDRSEAGRGSRDHTDLPGSTGRGEVLEADGDQVQASAHEAVYCL